MNKRSFKDIEEEMKQLANAYEAPFDEQAWVSMEALLDKDKERKRPPFFWFWWLLPIVVAGVAGVYYLYSNNKPNNERAYALSKTESTVSDNKNAVNPVGINMQPGSEINTQPGNADPAAGKPHNEQHISSGKNPVNDINTGIIKDVKHGNGSQKKNVVLYSSGKKAQQSKNKSRINVKASDPASDYAISTVQPEKQSVVIPDNKDADADKSLLSGVLPVLKNDSVISKTGSVNDSLKDKELVIADSLKIQTVETAGINETGKTNKKNNRGFYFIAAAGADAGGVKLFSIDKITARFGITVGYQFSKRLSLQTGFFTGNKKYVAGPGDYTAKAGTYWSVVDITKVDAGCRVYEIPLQLRYDFYNGNKTSFFVSAGLSSYIMKKEDYHYYYYRYGSLRDASASYTGNQHLFSVMRVAAGFERKIKGPFSIQLSPGISVPLAGVGEGQVKLFSTDLMIGLKFTPNRKK